MTEINLKREKNEYYHIYHDDEYPWIDLSEDRTDWARIPKTSIYYDKEFKPEQHLDDDEDEEQEDKPQKKSKKRSKKKSKKSASKNKSTRKTKRKKSNKSISCHSDNSQLSISKGSNVCLLISIYT